MANEEPLGEITGALLAGGRSLRMGRDKSLVTLSGKPMLAHVVARLRPQVHRIVISASEDSCFSGYCLPVVADALEGRAGPLAGLGASLRWAARETPDARYLATVPVDTPFLPADLVARLSAALRSTQAACAIAASDGMRHPVVGLWQTDLAGEVEEALRSGVRAMKRFAELQGSAVADFPMLEVAGAPLDPFFNVNTPADLKKAEALLEVLSATEPAHS